MKNKYSPIVAILMGTLFCFLFLYAAVAYSNDDGFFPEEVPALLEFANKYFETEAARDRDKVWEMIAPSSIFKQKYSYEAYCNLWKTYTVRIKSWDIKGGIVMINDIKDKFPNIERFGYVYVDITFVDEDAEWTTTFFMPFLKENGKWWKG